MHSVSKFVDINLQNVTLDALFVNKSYYTSIDLALDHSLSVNSPIRPSVSYFKNRLVCYYPAIYKPYTHLIIDLTIMLESIFHYLRKASGVLR